MREFRFRFLLPQPIIPIEEVAPPTTTDYLDNTVEVKVLHWEYGAAYNLALRKFLAEHPEADPKYRRHRGWW